MGGKSKAPGTVTIRLDPGPLMRPAPTMYVTTTRQPRIARGDFLFNAAGELVGMAQSAPDAVGQVVVSTYGAPADTITVERDRSKRKIQL